MNIKLYPILLLFIPLTNINGQVNIGDWKAYTSPLKIKKVITSNDSLICATEGGLLIKNQNNFSTFSSNQPGKNISEIPETQLLIKLLLSYSKYFDELKLLIEQMNKLSKNMYGIGNSFLVKKNSNFEKIMKECQI